MCYWRVEERRVGGEGRKGQSEVQEFEERVFARAGLLKATSDTELEFYEATSGTPSGRARRPGAAERGGWATGPAVLASSIPRGEGHRREEATGSVIFLAATRPSDDVGLASGGAVAPLFQGLREGTSSRSSGRTQR